MKKGEDQRAGVLGIGLAAGESARLARRAGRRAGPSPAGKAGLKKGDRIIEIDGRPIHTQTDLRFALGTALRRRQGPRRRQSAATKSSNAPSNWSASSSRFAMRSSASCRCARRKSRKPKPKRPEAELKNDGEGERPPASSCEWSIRAVRPPRPEFKPATAS